MSGKVVLITGGAFGLGLEFARELLRNGVKVVIIILKMRVDLILLLFN